MDRAVSLERRRIELAIERPFELGVVKVDPPAHEIITRTRAARMQPQTLKVLIALHDRIGCVVTREELIERCWDGRVVGEDVINRCISQLRSFARQTDAFRIQTVPRAGYRLAVAEPNSRFSLPQRRWIAAVALIVCAIAGSWLFLRKLDRTSQTGNPTVAVLPLVVRAHDGELQDLAAVSRSSLTDALTNGGYPVVVAGAPNARPDLVVFGNLHRVGGSVRALIQVEEKRDGIVVFTHTFEAAEADAQKLPDQIAASVAANLSWAATLIMLDRRHPSTPTVRAAILSTARLNVEGDDLMRAYDVARQIAPQAPNSAIAQFSLALDSGYIMGQLPFQQRAAAIQAGRQAEARMLALAPDFGDSYITWCSLHNPVWIGDCERQLRRGLSVDPQSAQVADGLSGLLNAVGRFNEAQTLAELSLANDPYQPSKLARLIRILEENGEAQKAEKLFRQSVLWWPHHHGIVWNRLVGISARGDYRALERLARDIPTDDLPIDRAALAEVIHAAQTSDAAAARRACASDQLRWTTQSLCMTTLADLGDVDRAFVIAHRLFPSLRAATAEQEEKIWLAQPDAFSVTVLSSPAAASLRRDPRFLGLANGSGLVQYWRSGHLPDFCTVRHETVCARLSLELPAKSMD